MSPHKGYKQTPEHVLHKVESGKGRIVDPHPRKAPRTPNGRLCDMCTKPLVGKQRRWCSGHCGSQNVAIAEWCARRRAGKMQRGSKAIDRAMLAIWERKAG